MKKLLLISVASYGLAGCGTLVNGPQDAFTPQEEHPITVDQQTVTMEIMVEPGLSDLTSVDKARLRALADNYVTRANGPITITAPSGGGLDLAGQELAGDIRQYLYEQGIDYSVMQGATYRSSNRKDVIVSFSQYVASASPCGDWSDEYMRRQKNKRSKNFGCASQNNLAAMIADPQDLVAADPLAPTDATRAVAAVQSFGDGEPTSSPRDPSIDVSSTE